MATSALDGLRTRVTFGGATKDELLLKLRMSGVRLNDFALTLFADPRFVTSDIATTAEVVQFSLASLGFSVGVTFATLVRRAAAEGLALCPLEVAPWYRLALLEQADGPVGEPATHGRAPPGSITVASRALDESDQTPKGFYLRRTESTLWLRGYRSWEGHLWSPDDAFLFVESRDTRPAVGTST